QACLVGGVGHAFGQRQTFRRVTTIVVCGRHAAGIPLNCARVIHGGGFRFQHKFVPERCSIAWRCLPKETKEATMLESEKFKGYARDCVRIAEKMNAKDRQTLLKIAEAWEARALEAERKEGKEKKADGNAGQLPA